MSKIVLYHGSDKILSKPLFGHGKIYNDYGQGFYCTQNIELAKEWACPTLDDGFVTLMNLKLKDLHFWIYSLNNSAHFTGLQFLFATAALTWTPP